MTKEYTIDIFSGAVYTVLFRDGADSEWTPYPGAEKCVDGIAAYSLVRDLTLAEQNAAATTTHVPETSISRAVLDTLVNRRPLPNAAPATYAELVQALRDVAKQRDLLEDAAKSQVESVDTPAPQFEAFQLTTQSRESNEFWPGWMHEAWNKDSSDAGSVSPYSALGAYNELMVRTNRGSMVVSMNDWIVRNPNGELGVAYGIDFSAYAVGGKQ